MQTKKQIMPLAALHFLLGAAMTIVFVITVILYIIDGVFEMDALPIVLTFAVLVGEFFVFAIPSFALGSYFTNMDSGKQVHNALTYSVSGWVIMFLYTAFYFVKILVGYGFVFELFLDVVLTLLPLIFLGIVYGNRHAYGSGLNAARVGSVLYFIYLGLFNTIYTAVTGIGSGALSIISFILRAIIGLTIPLSICYYYFKLESTAKPVYGQQYGPRNNYGYGPQQPYGQPYAPQQPYGQQYQQNPYAQHNNGYAAPAAPIPPVQQPVQQAPVQRQTASNFCTACGARVDANAAFCNNCGNKLA